MSLIRKSVSRLNPYTPGEQPKVPRIIKLNTNENPYPPSRRVFAALKNVDPAKLRLYPNPVSMELRRAIAKLHRCRVENVFIGNGSDEILALCARAFVERKGTIGYFDPSYSLYPVLAAIEDIRTRPVPLPDDFDWHMPAGYKASLFFLTNPNAPTSVLYSPNVVKKFCRSFGGVVVIDEAYVDFSRENCMELALARPNVLVLRTLSKSYSLAGLRLGYAVGDALLVEALDKIKDSYNVSYLSQEIGLAALRDQSHMRKNVRRVAVTREQVTRALRARGWRVFPSETNFLWAKPVNSSARRIFQRLRDQHIFVRYFSGKRTGDYLRITVGTSAQMRAFLSAL